MRPYRSLNVSDNLDELVLRLGRLQPTTRREWGTLTPHEMLCHLSDSFSAELGGRQISSAETWFSRIVIKRVALHTSFRWPQGVDTRPEVDPRRGGTKPADFDRDRTTVVELLRRFASIEARYSRHPTFGELTKEEWLLWGYGHVDHHLRQFGL